MSQLQTRLALLLCLSVAAFTGCGEIMEFPTTSSSFAPAIPVGSELKLYGRTLEDKEFDWGSYRGKYVLVEFTASWCGPCRGEAPNLLKAYEKYKDKDFTIVAVGIWDEAENLKEMVKEDKLPWTVISEELSEKAGMPKQGDHFGIKGVPTILLVDKDGKVIDLDLRGEVLQRKLAQLLDKP